MSQHELAPEGRPRNYWKRGDGRSMWCWCGAWMDGPIGGLGISAPEDVLSLDKNDRGEIRATGNLPSGNHHAILLLPCDENHANASGCDYSLVTVRPL